MSRPSVLVAGASIGGPAVAYWLVKAGCDVTVIERSPELRKNGQSIDIRNDGVRVMREMGIEEAVRAKTTKEAGLHFVFSSGRPFATFNATGNTEVQSMTSEFEIFRGDLGQIMYDVTKDKVKYIFGDYIAAMTQNEKSRTVKVDFHNGLPSQTFDLVVGCDGLMSRTRAMAFETTSREHLKPLNMYACYFTIDTDLLRGSQHSQWYSYPGGRSVYLRPDPAGKTRAGLNVVGPGGSTSHVQPFLDAEASGGREKIKQLYADLFRNTGWLSNEVVAGMHVAPDFYSGEIAQVYTPTLSRGRVALVGDAAYCPSPISGSGTTCALVGAYVLAGEISRSIRDGEDLDAALQRYDAEMMPRARRCQSLAPGAPAILNPQTNWGIWVMRAILAFVSYSGLATLVGKVIGGASFGPGVGLPEYKWNA